jgi:type I restriction enzyme, S subunit
MNSKTNSCDTKEEAKPMRVAKLRFPEFRGAEVWSIEEVGDLLDESRSPSLLNDPSKRITVRLHLQGVEHREHRGTESTESTNNFCRKAGQFIYGKQNIHKGAFGIIPDQLDGFESSQDLPCFDFKSRCCPQWFYYNFASESVYGPLEFKMTGTGSKRLNEKTFLSLPIAVPPYSEQQKIAECLSSVDELMAAQARKVDALKTHKKGLMQQLFPREGETQPRLRFPEFQNAGEWVEDTLDDIATFRRGSFPQPYGLPEWYDEKNGMPFIQVFDVGDDFRLKDKTKSKISKLGAEKSVFIPEGTLIVTLQGSIGRVAITHYDAYIDRTLLIFETFQKPIDKVFFSRVIQNLFDIEKEKAPGGIIKTITKESLSDFKVKYPTIDEQQRIATCLSSLDALITAETQKLEALKTHKKGLMQQLFPSPEALDGP